MHGVIVCKRGAMAEGSWEEAIARTERDMDHSDGRDGHNDMLKA
jgi:hypothetical protein